MKMITVRIERVQTVQVGGLPRDRYAVATSEPVSAGVAADLLGMSNCADYDLRYEEVAGRPAPGRDGLYHGHLVMVADADE